MSVGVSIGSVTGVLVGAGTGAFWRGHFRWEACDDPRELRRQIGGAFLMGGGGVVALGCSVGQGLAAFSVLAISAPVTIAAIVLGAFIGLRFLVESSTTVDVVTSRIGLFAQLFRNARGR
ncbi:MAG: YeeE/YedE family protein [Alphaproteobacteria bacterium]|nr:YeeE/YedE family protein [Alphaproteobacteria bacterium]